MICREIPISTLSREAEILQTPQGGEMEAYFAAGALAAMVWLIDPVKNPAPHTMISALGLHTLQ